MICTHFAKMICYSFAKLTVFTAHPCMRTKIFRRIIVKFSACLPSYARDHIWNDSNVSNWSRWNHMWNPLNIINYKRILFSTTHPEGRFPSSYGPNSTRIRSRVVKFICLKMTLRSRLFAASTLTSSHATLPLFCRMVTSSGGKRRLLIWGEHQYTHQ